MDTSSSQPTQQIQQPIYLPVQASPVPPVHLDVNIRGVVIPTWVAIVLSGVAVLAAMIVLTAVIVFRSAADSLAQSQTNQAREMRLIDLRLQDIENVLIRASLATREDFAPRKED